MSTLVDGMQMLLEYEDIATPTTTSPPLTMNHTFLNNKKSSNNPPSQSSEPSLANFVQQMNYMNQ